MLLDRPHASGDEQARRGVLERAFGRSTKAPQLTGCFNETAWRSSRWELRRKGNSWVTTRSVRRW